MRTFFSITPDPTSQLAIEDWYRLNWPTLTKPVPASNYHITLSFLGDIDAQQLHLIEELMDQYHPESFDLLLDVVGYFPDTGILWLGAKSIPEELLNQNRYCIRTANKAGIRVRKKNYHPHLTLARNVVNPPSAPLISPQFQLRIDELQLTRSLMERSGVHYLPVRVWRV